MKLLLDTHAFLRWVAADGELSRKAKSAIGSARNECFVSVASGWEIAIEVSLGKLRIDGVLDEPLWREATRITDLTQWFPGDGDPAVQLIGETRVGDYDVTLTLPKEMKGKVGASGVQKEEQEVGGSVRVRFVAEDVHDFAWTTLYGGYFRHRHAADGPDHGPGLHQESRRSARLG